MVTHRIKLPHQCEVLLHVCGQDQVNDHLQGEEKVNSLVQRKIKYALKVAVGELRSLILSGQFLSVKWGEKGEEQLHPYLHPHSYPYTQPTLTSTSIAKPTFTHMCAHTLSSFPPCARA